MRLVVRAEERPGPAVGLARPLVPSRCMWDAWQASNFMDSVTDGWFGGDFPPQRDFERIILVLLRMQDECGLDLRKVFDYVELSGAEAYNGVPEDLPKGRKLAGDARAEMQAILAGLAGG